MKKKSALTNQTKFIKMKLRSPALNSQEPSQGIFVQKKSSAKKKSLTNKRASAKINSQPPALVPFRKHRGGFLHKNKDIILVDGENFTHNLVRNLKSQGLVRSRTGLSKLNMAHITYFAKGAAINYYSNMIRVPKTSPLFSRAQNITKWNAKWIPYITNQGIRIIKAGLLRVRDGKTCQKCGAKSEVLLEKGVDVRVAIDIISLSGKNHQLLVLSSDTDLVPAIERAVSMGHEVIYVAFPGDIVTSLTKASSSVIILKNNQIKRAFKDVA